MFKDTRWAKILNDVWKSKTRTALVVLSIAVGVFAVGMVTNSRTTLRTDLDIQWQAINPSSTVLTTTPFQKDLARAVEGTREVESVEARRVETATIILPDGSNDDLLIYAAENPFSEQQLDTITVEQGASAPGLRGIALERMAAAMYDLDIGDTVTVEMRNEDTYDLTVTAIWHDMRARQPRFGNNPQAYVTMETLQWMGEPYHFNLLHVRTAELPDDKEHVLATLTDVRDRVIEPTGVTVRNMGLADVDPMSHWAAETMSTLLLILALMGFTSLVLCAGLVANTINAILTQQVKQIGIMRSVGAPKTQINQMYIGNILIFSTLALLISVPLGILGTAGLTGQLTTLLNFDVINLGLPLSVMGIQVMVGVLVPIVASILPITRSTRLTVYDAIYQEASAGVEKGNLINRALSSFSAMRRPLLLSLRNTFRRQQRLIATIATLSLAGMAFIGVVGVRTSMTSTLEQVAEYWLYDVTVDIPNSIDRSYIEREAQRISGVTVAEGWVLTSDATIVWPDDSESEEIVVWAPPEDSITYQPTMMEGRYLEPNETGVVAVNIELTSDYPQLTVGEEIELNLSGEERTFEIIGVTSAQLFGNGLYMSYDDYSQATNTIGEVNSLRIRANPIVISNPAVQEQMALDLSDRLETLDIPASTPQPRQERINEINGAFNIIVMLLIVMAALLAVVGGLGLAGTMSINVLERIREIGVLRAVGASNRAVRQVVVVEGIIIAMISWTIGTILSFPFAYAFSIVIGQTFLRAPLKFQWSALGALGWLVLVLVIGAAASIAPAQQASRITVREVLSTE